MPNNVIRIVTGAELARVLGDQHAMGFKGKKYQFVVSYDEGAREEGYIVSYKKLFGDVAVGRAIYSDKFFGTLDEVADYIDLIELGGL